MYRGGGGGGGGFRGGGGPPRGGGRGRGGGGGRGGRHVPLTDRVRDVVSGLRPGTTMSNYYVVETNPQTVVHRYSVSMSEEVSMQNLKYRQWRQAVNRSFRNIDEEVPWDEIVYDGTSMHTLRKFDCLVGTYDVKGRSVGRGKPPPQDKVVIEYLSEVKYLTTGDSVTLKPYEQMMNEIMKGALRAGAKELSEFNGLFVEKRPKRFDDANIDREMEIMPGYRPEIHNRQNVWYCCVGAQNKTVQRKTALDVMSNARKNRELDDKIKRAISKDLLDMSVCTDYTWFFYKVERIVWSLDSTKPMNKKDENGETFVQYYKRKYNIDIRFPKAPLLSVESRGGSCFLVPELARLTGVPDNMRDVVTRATQEPPHERLDMVLRFSDYLKGDVGAFLARWGLRVSGMPVIVPYHQCPLPTVYLGRQPFNCTQDRLKWNAELGRMRLGENGQSMGRWVICYRPSVERFAKEIGEKFCRKAREHLGAKWTEPKWVAAEDEYMPWIEVLESKLPGAPTFVLVVANDVMRQEYSDLKQWCSQKNIASQCCVARNHMHRMGQGPYGDIIASNLFLQGQVKLGAHIWAMDLCEEVFGVRNAQGVLMIGIDVYKAKKAYNPITGRRETPPSLIALAAFMMDAHAMRPYATYAQLDRMSEAGEKFIAMFEGCISAFKNLKRKDPFAVVVYRNSVSEGMFESVVKNELDTCRETMRNVIPSSKLIFVCLQRQVDSRFFLFTGAQGDGVQNSFPGTFVKDVVTRNQDQFFLMDFFMQSVSPTMRGGSARPVHYDVLYNNASSRSDYTVQTLTFQLCHLYFNWPGAVALPAPAMYAHKYAYTSGEHFMKTVMPGDPQKPEGGRTYARSEVKKRWCFL